MLKLAHSRALAVLGGIVLLLAGCGSSAAPAAPATLAFPNTLNLPTIAITDRVVNLSGQGGYQYAKLSLAVEFADTKAQFTKANGAALTKLQATFTADHQAAVNAFNDIIITDVAQQSPDRLQSPAGKEALRQELIKDFNARLAAPPPVVWVEFTDFVMQ
ncbi:MAG: flagellar basal body-associated FliL family protein [Chloroflexota bacterium]